MSFQAFKSVKKLTPTALLLSLALITTACGSSGNPATGDQAAVSVGSIESGCAEGVDLSRLLSGAPYPSITSTDMTDFAAGASSLGSAFPDRTTEVSDYLALMSEVVGDAADKANEESDISAQQILLLLDFEKAGRAADFERLSPDADEYFTRKCGSAYTAIATGSAANNVAVAPEPDTGGTTTADTAAPTDETTTTTAAGATETTVTAPAVSAEAVVVNTSSIGSLATFFGVEMQVGEIWRTTLTPEAALTGGTEIAEQRSTLVQIRLTSGGSGKNLDARSFGWVDGEGFRTVAQDALLDNGTRWNLDVAENESKSGYLVFEGDLGDPTGATLQWRDDDLAPANAPLGVGPTTPPYPVPLSYQVNDPGRIPMPPTSFECVPSYVAEVRSSQATLDYKQFSLKRADLTERFITIELAMKLGETTGDHSTCETQRNLSGTHDRIRLVLGNGDAISPLVADSDSIKPDATSVKEFIFSVPADTTSLQLVDADGAVFADWTDIVFPDL